MTLRVVPRTIESYRQSCLAICAERLKGYETIDQIAADEDKLNAYPRLDQIEEPRGVVSLEAEALTAAQMDRALNCVLDGRFLAEHAAAGEATRLKMGTKYLINPARSLDLETVARMWSQEAGQDKGRAEVLEKTGGAGPQDLLDLSLGARHMLQMAFDLTRLAQDKSRRPQSVLESQWMIIVLNQASAQTIISEMVQARFFGFNPEQVLFLVQESFEGINLKEGRFFFDPQAPKRLHNHGQMAMQLTAENQVFKVDPKNPEQRTYLSPEQTAGILDKMDDKLSYNIEDLAYLNGALDLEALALALDLSDQGQRMVMEIVANDPDKPIKGGLAAWDRVLEKNVMIESFQLLDKPNEELTFLNRNFNHYPKPLAAFQALASGLPMPLAVKGGYLYFQPIQGDLNFLLPTAFVQRKVMTPISSWKSAANTPEAIRAMAGQDRQPGFKDFAQEILQRSL